MPNLVYCSLIMQGDQKDIDHVKQSISGLDEEDRIRPIDFYKIIPMPPELNVSDMDEVKAFCRQKFIKKTPEKHLEIFLKAEGTEKYQSYLLLAEKYYDNYLKHGYMTWYDWCIEKWGTKWNAMYDEFQEQNNAPTIIHFITATDPPIPVLNTLACKYPKISFSLEYFYESNHKDITTVEFKVGEPPQTT